MSTKRKRSIGSSFTPLTFEASLSPFLSSPVRLPEFFGQSKTLESQSSPCSWKGHNTDSTKTQEEETSQQVNSRTRKRHRDGRPEEAEIHASTVEKLFSAQKVHPHASPQPSQQLQPQLQHQDAPLQRSTLHSFWHLPHTSQTLRHGMPARMPQQDMWTCDGCDKTLTPEYGMDVDADTACRACGKHVCDTCAIAAEMRLCLDCAMQA